jgi:hypothetical protein
MTRFFYIPDVLQYSDFDCGTTCTQAVMAYYGEDIEFHSQYGIGILGKQDNYKKSINIK